MKRWIPLSISLILSLVVGLPLSATQAVAQQTASITGTVSDAETGEPLAGANVLALRPGTTSMVTGSATDIDGNYRLAGLEPGTYDIVARFVGFREQRQPITLAAGEQRALDIEMVATGLDLNPVVVTASRRQEKSLDAPASVSVLEAQELVSDAAPSPAASLRYTPGVDIAQSGVDRYQISLRGFNSVFVAKTYALVDYRQAVAPSLGINAFASMPIAPIDLAQVEVVRGPGSALYGPGVEQGVVHFITKDPLNYPGTSLMIGGGERSTLQGALRHAGIINNRLGYKVVGYYSQAEDWDFDRDDPADLAILCANVESDCEVNEAGEVVSVNSLADRPDDADKYYAAGTLQYQFAPDVQLTGSGGYSSISQVNQANTGENVTDNFVQYYGQLRLQAGGLFAQAYYNRLDAGDTYFYRSGNPVVDESSQVSGQVQYSTSVLDGRQQFIGGIDYKQTVARTGGTIHGRNEEDDTLTEYGAYLQSETDLTEQLHLTLTGRVDRDDVIEKTQFSPRAALVYRPVPEHSLRATFNRAFTTPAGVNLFLDLFVEDRGPFSIRGRGAADPFTFSNATSSFFLGPGERYDGIGIPLNLAYQALIEQLIAAGAFPAALRDPLLAQAGEVTGFSQGVLGFPNDAGGVDFVNTLEDTDPIEQTVTNSVELGYKGLIADRFLVGVDVFYTQKTNFLSELQVISPLVLVPGLSSDLTEAINGAFSDEELAALGLTREQLVGAFAAAASQVSAAGIAEPDQNYDPSTEPELMLTYLNFGDVDYYGTDLAIQWLATDRLTVFGNYSWLSDNFFDAEELDESGSGRVISMNAPKNKFSLGGEYSIQGGLSVNAAARYVDEFDVRSGVYQGTVPSYFLLDLGAGYDFVRTVPGLRLDVTAQNVLDNEHRQYVGAPELGRLITARLTYTLR